MILPIASVPLPRAWKVKGWSVEVLPALVRGLFHDREEDEPRQRDEVLHRAFGFLHHGIRRRDADLGLAGDHRLDCEVFLGEGSHLQIDAFFLGALERDGHGKVSTESVSPSATCAVCAEAGIVSVAAAAASITA
jgi:hypothetical protein